MNRFHPDYDLVESLEDYLVELLQEVCPLLNDREARREASNRKDRAYDFISDHIDKIKEEREEASKSLEKMEEENSSLKEDIRELDEENSKLKVKLEDLEFRLRDPTGYYGKKFNI